MGREKALIIKKREQFNFLKNLLPIKDTINRKKTNHKQGADSSGRGQRRGSWKLGSWGALASSSGKGVWEAAYFKRILLLWHVHVDMTA
jgi:hypothetical protein